VASLSQGRTAAAQCGLFTYKSVPVIFEPPCIMSLDCDNWASFWCHFDDEQAFCGQLCSPVGNVINYLLTNKEPKLDRIKLLKVEG